MSDWKVLVGRISLFPTTPSPSPTSSALELFRRVWGGEPDNFNKPPNALMATVAQGKRGTISANCSVHPARIDFNLTPAPAPGGATEMSLPTIEDMNQLQNELTQIIAVIGKEEISNSVSRAALYLQFVKFGPDFAEINKMLVGAMPSRYGVSLTDEEDLIFQINRPKMSDKVQGVRMNYITKWSVDRFQVLTISIPTAGTPISIPIGAAGSLGNQTKEFLVGSVVFDHNNLPAPKPLNGKEQAALLTDGLAAIGRGQREFGMNVKGF